MTDKTTTLKALGSTAELGKDARREIGKWLNEEQTRPIDRTALAEMCADYDRLKRIEKAAQNLVQQKGRHHTEQAYNALVGTLWA